VGVHVIMQMSVILACIPEKRITGPEKSDYIEGIWNR
jgi:hypothetical protein